MQITWTNCGDELPPHEEIIIRYQLDAPKLFDGSKLTDSFARIFSDLLKKTVWTRFTQEKWEFLNK